MYLKCRLKKNLNEKVAPGAKELVFELEQKCYIKQLAIAIFMNNTTGTHDSRLIIKIDEDEVLNEDLRLLRLHYCGGITSPNLHNFLECVRYDDTNKNYSFIFTNFSRVDRRLAIFFENKDTTNTAWVHIGVIYDILED